MLWLKESLCRGRRFASDEPVPRINVKAGVELNILFMCVANSARSQMAEGLAKQILGADVTVQSAGSHPGKLNSYAVEALRERGLDISKHWSKSIDDLSPGFIVKLDYVITLCAEEVCPIMVSKGKKIHWPFPDPASIEGSDAVKLNSFRTVRDEIEKAILRFKSEAM
jgi:arsenate reductase (thioredoxin)